MKTTFFLFFPATFYFLVRYLTGRRLAAILAVLIVLLPQYFFAKSRIVSGYLGGDCPHIASLTMLPLAIYGLISFLRKGSFSNLVTAAATGLTIILISPFGFLAYVVFAFLTTFSEMLLSSGRIKFLRYGLTLAVIVALSSFWYNPAFVFWMISGPFGNDLRLTVSHLLPISIFTVPILGTLGFLLFDRKPNLQPLFLASFWTLTFLAIFFFSRSNFLSATASRSLPELGISLAFLFGATVSVLIDRLKKPIFRNSLTIFITVALVLWIIFARESPVLSGKEVSNYWANESSVVEKGKLWLARDKFDGWSGMVGYVITGTTLITIGLVFLKAKRKVGE